MNKDKIMALIKRKSDETGVSVNILLLLYFFETFLERVSKSRYKTDLILKGGFLLSSMLGIDTRTTMDMDMAFRNHALDVDSIRNTFSEIISENENDGIRFEIKSIAEIKMADEYPGYRVSIIGCIENIKQPFSIDVVTGDMITPDAMVYRYNSIFHDGKDITTLSYNLETIIAEKLETLVSRKTDNSRSKDFYDLYVLFSLKGSEINKGRLYDAVQNTFNHRNTEFDTDSIIEDLDNIANDAGFEKRWDVYCKRNNYVDPMPLSEMIDRLKFYINVYLVNPAENLNKETYKA